jgi:hypothetical protein
MATVASFVVYAETVTVTPIAVAKLGNMLLWPLLLPRLVNMLNRKM